MRHLCEQKEEVNCRPRFQGETTFGNPVVPFSKEPLDQNPIPSERVRSVQVTTWQGGRKTVILVFVPMFQCAWLWCLWNTRCHHPVPAHHKGKLWPNLLCPDQILDHNCSHTRLIDRKGQKWRKYYRRVFPRYIQVELLSDFYFESGYEHDWPRDHFLPCLWGDKKANSPSPLGQEYFPCFILKS